MTCSNPPKTRMRGGKRDKSAISADEPMRTLPPSFVPVPTTLAPVLSQLSPDHVYIIHIDGTTQDFKKKIFLVPVLMNILIVLGIAWRVQSILPYYAQILLSTLETATNSTTSSPDVPLQTSVYEIAGRALQFMIDFIIYVYVVRWPYEFLFGSKDIGSPIWWRWNIGFRQQEIVVRRSRRWEEDLSDVVSEPDSSEYKSFAEIIRVATAPSYMFQRTGYSMLNKHWDLDWKSMILCSRLLDSGALPMNDSKTAVLVYSHAFQWVLYQAGNEISNTLDSSRRAKIVAFKDALTALGKENLFFRWVELIQYESSQPGEFGPDRQLRTMRMAKEMFEAQGVDFEQFWTKIGGMEGLPGIEMFGSET